MRRAFLLALLLFPWALGHSGDLEVEDLRIRLTREGAFLEGRFYYPNGDDPLTLAVVATDRGEGVLEVRRSGVWEAAPAVRVRYGITNVGPATELRIRLTGGPYRPGEEVPVTFLFPAGALHTVPARVVGTGLRGWTPLLAAGALLLALVAFKTRRRAGSG